MNYFSWDDKSSMAVNTAESSDQAPYGSLQEPQATDLGCVIFPILIYLHWSFTLQISRWHYGVRSVLGIFRGHSYSLCSFQTILSARDKPIRHGQPAFQGMSQLYPSVILIFTILGWVPAWGPISDWRASFTKKPHNPPYGQPTSIQPTDTTRLPSSTFSARIVIFSTTLSAGTYVVRGWPR